MQVGGFVSLPIVVFTEVMSQLRQGSAAAGGGTENVQDSVPEQTVDVSWVDRDSVVKQAVLHLNLTHHSPVLDEMATVYVELLLDLLLRPQQSSGVEEREEGDLHNVRRIIAHAGASIQVDIPSLFERYSAPGEDAAVVGSLFSIACYITDSFPSLLFLAYKYADTGDIQQALLANTNCGGENCHRGSALGAVVGLVHGMRGLRRNRPATTTHSSSSEDVAAPDASQHHQAASVEGLVAFEDLEREIQAWDESVWR